MMTNPCTNIFLEDDGYCTRCGQYHFKMKAGMVSYPKPKEQKRAHTKKEKPNTPEQKALAPVKIVADPIFWHLIPFDWFQVSQTGWDVSDGKQYFRLDREYYWSTWSHLVNVMFFEHNLYISTSLLTTITGWDKRTFENTLPTIQYGRKTFYNISEPDIARKVIQFGSGPRRNDRELFVGYRNKQIWQFLYDHREKGMDLT